MTTLPLLSPLAPEVSPADAERRERQLLEELRAMGSALVAFSGGADSAYVAWAAARALGARSLAVTGVSATLAAGGADEAEELARAIGIAHQRVDTAELSDPRYLANGPDRCYFCKDELYQRLDRLAAERGLAVVIDGTNLDDLGDHRPGRQAAARHGVRSPLIECGIGKAELRWLSRRAGLPTWDKPAAPCLSSRVPHGQAIEPRMLLQVDRAEAAVRALGFRELRVRHLGERARVELAAAELGRALEPATRERIARGVRAAGFGDVAVDERPLRSGRLSEESRGRIAGGAGRE
jgi:uncharacterized protein